MASTGVAGRAGSNGHVDSGEARAPGGEAGSGPSLLGRAVRGVARQVQSRIPRADLDERDPDFIRERLPLMWLAASLWYRGEVRGLGNIPDEGPVLMVGNHSGGNMTPDTVVFTLAFNTYFGVERAFYQLAHNLVLSMPGLGSLRRFGTVAASPANARKALQAGAALLVYPGGDYEVHRPFWQRNRVDFDGRKGFIRLALQENVPDRARGLHRRPGDGPVPHPRRGPGPAARARPAVSPQGPPDLAGGAVGPERRRHAGPPARCRPRSPSRPCRRSTSRPSSGPTPISTRSTIT